MTGTVFPAKQVPLWAMVQMHVFAMSHAQVSRGFPAEMQVFSCRNNRRGGRGKGPGVEGLAFIGFQYVEECIEGSSSPVSKVEAMVVDRRGPWRR